MANSFSGTIKLKSSVTSGSVPAADDLTDSEIAFNRADFKLFGKDTSNTVKCFNDASNTSLDTTNFDNVLSSSDNTIQKALETIDDFKNGISVNLSSAAGNEMYGKNVGNSTMTGTYNTMIGNTIGQAITSGARNQFMGYSIAGSCTEGYDNIGIGYNVFSALTSGYGNIGIGTNALGSITTGNNNTALGYNAGYTNTGSGNVFLGAYAGYNETGSNKLYIHNSSADSSNVLIYGEFDNKILRINNKLGIGKSPTVELDINGQVNITDTSDEKLKLSDGTDEVSVLTGTTDPTTSAVDADIGSIYINTSTGTIYRKTDEGSSTNWKILEDVVYSRLPAYEALTANDAVHVFNDSGTVKVRKAYANSSSKYEAHGYVRSAVSSGSTATVYYGGTLSGLSGLTAGGNVYLSDTVAGGYTSTVPSGTGELVQYLGRALSSSSFVWQWTRAVEV